MKNAELNKYYKELDRKYRELEKKYNELYDYISRVRLEVDDLRITTWFLKGDKNNEERKN